MEQTAKQQQGPGLHVLVAPLGGPIGCADLAIALQNAFAEFRTQPAAYDDIIPKGKPAHWYAGFGEVIF